MYNWYQIMVLSNWRHEELQREAEHICLLRSLRSDHPQRSEVGTSFHLKLQIVWQAMLARLGIITA